MQASFIQARVNEGCNSKSNALLQRFYIKQVLYPVPVKIHIMNSCGMILFIIRAVMTSLIWHHVCRVFNLKTFTEGPAVYTLFVCRSHVLEHFCLNKTMSTSVCVSWASTRKPPICPLSSHYSSTTKWSLSRWEQRQFLHKWNEIKTASIISKCSLFC